MLSEFVFIVQTSLSVIDSQGKPNMKWSDSSLSTDYNNSINLFIAHLVVIINTEIVVNTLLMRKDFNWCKIEKKMEMDKYTLCNLPYTFV